MSYTFTCTGSPAGLVLCRRAISSCRLSNTGATADGRNNNNDGFSYFQEEIGDFKGENEGTISFGQCKTFIGETR